MTPTQRQEALAKVPLHSDGRRNWRAIVRPEHLYIKREHEGKVAAMLKRPLTAISVTEVEDKYLVIRKAGILELAEIRGFKSAIPDVAHVQSDYVVVRTTIDWLPLDGEDAISTGGIGEAHTGNCTDMGRNYLASTAENRAFSRAVRQFLQIDIVSSDELGGNTEPPNEPTRVAAGDVSPQATLERVATEAGSSWEKVKQGGIKYRDKMTSDPDTWTAFADVPPPDCMELIGRIKAAKAK